MIKKPKDPRQEAVFVPEKVYTHSVLHTLNQGQRGLMGYGAQHAYTNLMQKYSFQSTDPIQHENLQVQFLLGRSAPPDYLTLGEGCRLGIVEILETGTVGQLSVHNHSPKKPLFMQLGELLKGGLQDRTIATDL